MGMQIGYDYLIMRTRYMHRFLRNTGMFFVVTGATLLALGFGYYLYAQGVGL
jgi:hypothetical protein